ncbi:MAG: hypothetical protein HY688_03915, partial [Chloroflexi bacterium]|nr:hypothetical protein [Chloroflexota bacterium]
MNTILPILSSAIMLTFVVIVLRRWLVRRRAALLLWGIGLAMFAAGSISEVYS